MTHCPRGHPVTDAAPGMWWCAQCEKYFSAGSCREQEETPRTAPPTPRPRPTGSRWLGVDPGAATGLALLDSRTIVRTWTVRWRDSRDLRGYRQLVAVAAEVADLVNGQQVSLVAERPVAARKGSGSVKSWMGLGAYLGRVEQELARHLGAYPERVEVREWREAVGLPAACSKQESLAAARRLGFGGDNHNEAEAVLIAAAAARRSHE